MPTGIVSDARAWRAATVDAPSTWYYPLSERCLDALDETIRELRCHHRPTTELYLVDTPCAAVAGDLQPVRAALENGRGFAIIQGPSSDYSTTELQAVYWLVGQMLGTPVEQNVQGTLLYDVRDTGQDVRSGVRFSVTNAESSFHTDNSFGESIVDYVGLLCLNPARSGGHSQVVSAHAALDQLQARHPKAIAVLSRPFHVDRRGGTRPGEAPTIRVPIVSQEKGLVCRYLRFWIEAGHDKAGAPLTAEQIQAMDALDEVLNDPALRAEFDLRPREMFFINNRWIFHNRTGFEDHAEPERKRHYVRLWLRSS